MMSKTLLVLVMVAVIGGVTAQLEGVFSNSLYGGKPVCVKKGVYYSLCEGSTTVCVKKGVYYSLREGDYYSMCEERSLLESV
ncbi:hypothetical protein Btru_032502 [Bulinus truncatus]|nr:hypothetical protein Btru_032502 [Bulinus truncatus]